MWERQEEDPSPTCDLTTVELALAGTPHGCCRLFAELCTTLRNWKRADYLLHRWLSIAIGLVVLSWFVSGFAMMYYPWPASTESARLGFDAPFDVPPSVIGVRRASSVAMQAVPKSSMLTRARLTAVGPRLVYAFSRERAADEEQAALVDAASGELISPLDSSAAVAIARTVVSAPARVIDVSLEPRGDHYLMSGEYRRDFPDWVVRFDDPRSTAVYVSKASGHITGVVTRRTRVTTWLGVVPHWLYFQWLYERPDAWLWLNLILPGVAAIAACAGLILGVTQLFTRGGRDKRRRASPYRGVSRWHHLIGATSGIVVLTWTFSGVLTVLGPDNVPRPGQLALARGGAMPWTDFSLTEADALAALRRIDRTARPRAIDALAVAGQPGYVFHLTSGDEVWVNAVTGLVRSQLDSAAIVDVSRRVLPHARIARFALLSSYDAYYYARPHREMHLPVWRVQFDDAAHSMLYLDAVSGAPTGFVDDEFRRWRWMRDGLHSIDFPGINGRHPLWDVVVLVLLLGGTLSAATGVWLAWCRVRRFG